MLLAVDWLWEDGVALAAQDALAQAKEQGVLVACVDPFNPPFSSNNPGTPGFDVEIAREIAQEIEVRINYFWADTGTRGGLGRALRRSILQQKCSFFMGMPTGEEAEEELAEKGLELTKPYMGTGYVLVRKQGGPEAQGLEDLKDTKIAVAMVSAADGYLFYNGYHREIYRSAREALEALQKGEVEAGLLWAPTAGWWIHQYPHSGIKLVEGYVPKPGMRWNLAIAVRKEDRDLKEVINQIIDRLIHSGRVKEIVAKYGLPFYSPFE